jgi:hypothetical protein
MWVLTDQDPLAEPVSQLVERVARGMFEGWKKRGADPTDNRIIWENCLQGTWRLMAKDAMLTLGVESA